MGGLKFKIHFFLIKWIAATLYDWMCIYIRRLKSLFQTIGWTCINNYILYSTG